MEKNSGFGYGVVATILSAKGTHNAGNKIGDTFEIEGPQGQDFHVYPKHPAYCKKPIPTCRPDKAKKLLVEAGYPQGIDLKLAVGVESGATLCASLRYSSRMLRWPEFA